MTNPVPTERREGLLATLDLAWDRINALGGYAAPHDDVGTGFNYAVEKALEIIEELGGMDPGARAGR